MRYEHLDCSSVAAYWSDNTNGSPTHWTVGTNSAAWDWQISTSSSEDDMGAPTWDELLKQAEQRKRDAALLEQRIVDRWREIRLGELRDAA